MTQPPSDKHARHYETLGTYSEAFEDRKPLPYPREAEFAEVVIEARGVGYASHPMNADLLTLGHHALARAAEAGETMRLLLDVSPTGELQPAGLIPLSTVKVADRPTSDSTDRLNGALARALQRGERRAAEILDGPEMLSSDAVAARLGVSRETVNRMRQRGELLGLERARRGVRYPDWQLSVPDQLPFPAMPDLFRVLGEPWSVYRFLLQQHPELGGRRAFDVLLAGDTAGVIALAESITGGVFS